MVKRGIPEFRAEFRNCNGNGNASNLRNLGNGDEDAV